MSRTPTRPPIRRDFAPYRPPTFWDPTEVPPRGRVAVLDPPPDPSLVNINGEFFRVSEGPTNPHHPGIAGAPRRHFDFRRPGGLVAFRVITYPDGPRCTCTLYERVFGCDHVAHLFHNGCLPEAEGMDPDDAPEMPEGPGGEP